jgi:hypothetical protein
VIGSVSARRALLTTCLSACLFLPAPTPGVQAAEPLAPVAFLAGGIWRGTGIFPDGTPLNVEERYFWGPTRRILHFEAFSLASGERHLLYEGFVFFDVKRGRILQFNFKPGGEHTESEITSASAEGYEVRGEIAWSLIRYSGANEYLWEVRVKQNGEWKSVLHATYTRVQ